MKRNQIALLAALVVCGSVQAQDIYKIEVLSGSDLNGTARYVGMGGAMNALGADLSTIGTNPAAIGMYRRHDFALTGSATIQPNGEEMGDINRARGSFDQAGFVYSAKIGGKNLKYFNLAMNYQKRRNLKNYIGTGETPTQAGMSQSWQMHDLAYASDGTPLNLAPGSSDAYYTTPLTLVGYDAQLIAPAYNADGSLAGYDYSNAQAYAYNRVQWGGVQEYDFNLSFNLKDRFYAGLTVGVYNVDFHTRTDYAERLVDGSGKTGVYNMYYDERLTGTGFDVKLGFIFRPVAESPFRIGVAVSTPVYYDLDQDAYLYMSSPYEFTDNGTTYERTEADYEYGDYEYRIRTPWKLNVSMATTVGNFLALDAEYEFANYKGTQLRYPDYDYGYYDDYGYGAYRSSTRDKAMDVEIDNFLKPVHTFRIGAELRLIKTLYGRIGYNYVSDPFDKDAYLNAFTESPSYNYSLNTDYVNLGAINRVTAGLGYRGRHVYVDVAYQFQRQQGDVYAFHVSDGETTANYLPGKKADLNRHNIMATLGFKF